MTSKLVTVLDAVPAPVAARFHGKSLLAKVGRSVINRVASEGPTAVTVRSGVGRGLRLLIDPSCEKYYWTGTHATPVQEALARLLSPGMTFWDVGAHIGFMSLIGSRLVGHDGQVRAFEPLPANMQRLKQSLALNSVTNVTAHEVAVTSESGLRNLHEHESSTRWTLVRELGQGDGIAVACTTLDDELASADAPDVVKIDVEGAELAVLAGGCQLLNHYHPALIVEFHSDAALQEARDSLPQYSFEHLGHEDWLLT